MSFNFPENVNEPTHSTQFSFDESLITPNLLASPSLSNRRSNEKPKNQQDDVVEAVSIMQKGCFMIIINLPNDSGENEQKELNVEWNICHLDEKKQNISIMNTKSPQIGFKDIEKVSKLHKESALRVQQSLHIDGVKQIGLQAVTLRLNMKSNNKHCYYLIFDEYRTAFIWNRGLRTLLEMSKISQPITTIAMVCSNIDRINNNEMHEKMSINNNDTFKWINHIADTIENIEKHINRSHDFAQQSCILDSTEHLTLLMQTKSLKNMLIDTKKLVSTPYYQLSKDEIITLREVWLSLLADLSVAMLKEHQLRNDMKLSRQTLTKQI